jgi:hypothetical protein
MDVPKSPIPHWCVAKIIFVTRGIVAVTLNTLEACVKHAYAPLGVTTRKLIEPNGEILRYTLRAKTHTCHHDLLVTVFSTDKLLWIILSKYRDIARQTSTKAGVVPERVVISVNDKDLYLMLAKLLKTGSESSLQFVLLVCIVVDVTGEHHEQHFFVDCQLNEIGKRPPNLFRNLGSVVIAKAPGPILNLRWNTQVQV